MNINDQVIIVTGAHHVGRKGYYKFLSGPHNDLAVVELEPLHMYEGEVSYIVINKNNIITLE